VTDHDAFGYYLDRYGLELVGSVIPSFDSSAELSGRDIRDLVAKVRATGVKAIFSETTLPPGAAETIGREAGVKVVTGDDALYGDALGPPGSDGHTYIKMIRHNTATIVCTLSGPCPPPPPGSGPARAGAAARDRGLRARAGGRGGRRGGEGRAVGGPDRPQRGGQVHHNT